MDKDTIQELEKISGYLAELKAAVDKIINKQKQLEQFRNPELNCINPDMMPK